MVVVFVSLPFLYTQIGHMNSNGNEGEMTDETTFTVGWEGNPNLANSATELTMPQVMIRMNYENRFVSYPSYGSTEAHLPRTIFNQPLINQCLVDRCLNNVYMQ